MKRPTINIKEDMKDLEIMKLKAAIKENKNLRIYERYQTILMYLHGMPPKEINEVTGRSLSTVYNYINSYKQDGIEGLKMEYSTGRPRHLTSEQEQQVYRTIVDKSPADVGFPAKMNWTAPIVRKWIEQEFSVSYSERGARELLYRLELSFTTPTYTLAKADPVKQEAFKQEFEDTKKNSKTQK